MSTPNTPKIYTETLPSGRVRAGFRFKGRKFQATHDYGFEAEAWAEAERDRVMARHVLGLPLVEGETLPAAPQVAPADEVGSTSESPSFAAYAESYLAARRGSISPATSRNYRTHLDAILRDTGDDAHRRPIHAIAIGALKRSDVEAWRTRSKEAGAGVPTLNARLKFVRAVCRYAVDEEILATDPTRSIKLLRHDTATAKEAIGPDEETALLAQVADNDAARLLILLGLDAGLRWQEAAAVDTSSTYTDDEGRSYVLVRQTTDRYTDEIVPTTKSGRRRYVPVTTDRLAREIRRAQLAATPGGLLATRTDGRTIGYDYFRHNTWKGITHRAGLNVRGGKRFGFHELRHTYATRLADAGVPIKEISKLLGHADVATTERYLHGGTDRHRHDLVTKATAATTPVAV